MGKGAERNGVYHGLKWIARFSDKRLILHYILIHIIGEYIFVGFFIVFSSFFFLIVFQFGAKISDLHVFCCILDLKSLICFWLLALAFGFWLWLLAFGCWLLAFGFGFWLLAFGWVLVL